MQFQRRKSKSGYVGARGRDLAGEVGTAAITPLPSRRYFDDLPRHRLPWPGRTQREDGILSEDTARECFSLDGKDDELDVLAPVNLILCGLQLQGA